MKNKSLLILCLLLALTSKSFAQNRTKLEEADRFFSNSTLLSYDQNIKPQDLIGSLIYYKKDQKDNFEYIPILNDSLKAIFKPTLNNEIRFQAIVDNSFIAKIGYLGIFNAEVKTRDLLEIILEDVLDYRCPTFTTNQYIYTQVLKISENLLGAGYIVEYVDKVNLCNVTSRLFREKGAKVGLSYIDSNGKKYSKATEFNVIKLLDIHSNQIIPFVDENRDHGKGITSNEGFERLSGNFKPIYNRKYIVVNKLVMSSKLKDAF